MIITPKQQIVVIGAGYAGLMAAIRLAKRTPRHVAKITLINATDHFVERIRLHQVAAGQTLKQHPIKRLLARTGIQFVQGWVESLQPEQKTVTVRIGHATQTIAYNTLVYALGSHTDRHRIPGVIDHAYTLDPASTAQLSSTLSALANAGAVLIIGGGLTGIEAATEIAERYPQLRVTLATTGSFADQLSRAGQDYLRQVFAQLRITIREQTTIRTLTDRQALTTSDDSIQFDACVFTAGFTVPALARQAGLTVNAIGQIVVDPYFRSLSHPDVYAIGDSAALDDETGFALRMACATAMPMAAHAADVINSTLTGRPAEPFAFGYALRCISLGRRRGLVQLVNSADMPQERIITGRQGALVKELICRYTALSLYWTRRIPRFYWWSKARRVGSIQSTLNEVHV